MQEHFIYEFGAFRLEPRERLLLREGKPVNLSPQLLSLLLLLLEEGGCLVTKEDLRRKLWESTQVSQDGLKVAVRNLRKVLGDGQNGDHYIENVRGGGYRFVSEIRKIRESRPAIHPQPGFSRVRKNSLRIALVAASGLLVVTICILYYYRPSRQGKDNDLRSAVPDIAFRKTAVLLPFNNLSERREDEWLSAAFPEWLSSEVGAGGQLRVLPGEQFAELRRDLSWKTSDSYSAEQLAQIKDALGATIIIMGAFATEEGQHRRQLRLDLKVVDASGGQLIASLTQVGGRDDLFDLIARSGGALRDRLGLREIGEGDARALRVVLPANQKAAELYIAGVEKFRQLDPLAARVLLEEAVSADTDYPLAHAALSAVWSAMGYDLNARAEANKALKLASGLSREQFLGIEATYHEAEKDWTRAEQIYQALSTFAPDNADYCLRLARAQTNGRRGKEALTTLAALRSSHSAAANDPQIDFQEAKAFESLGDFQHELVAADQAISNGKASNARQLVGNALIAKAWALDNVGHAKDAGIAAQEAINVYASISDESGMGWALKMIGDAVSDEGNHAEAIANYERALEAFRHVGNEHGIIISLNNMAFDLKDSGDLDRAKKTFGEAISVCEKTGDTRDEVLSVNGLGTIFWREGDLIAARKMYESALAQFRSNNDEANTAKMLRNVALIMQAQGELAKADLNLNESLTLDRKIGNRQEIAASLDNICELSVIRGDFADAQSRCDESKKLGEQDDDKRSKSDALVGLAQILTAKGDVAEARNTFQEPIRMRAQSGEKGLAGEAAILMAQLELDNGDLPEAEHLVLQAKEEFDTEHRIDEQALALAALGNVHLKEGKISLAENEIGSAREESKRSQDLIVSLQITSIAAELEAAKGKLQDSASELRAILKKCKQYGYVAQEMTTRLLLGDIELRIDRNAGQLALRTLAEDAKQKGFLLISSKAVHALGGS